MELTPDDMKVVDIFYPRAARKMEEARQRGQKFVHYCDGQAAMSMLQKKEVWMRKTTFMNDFLEIEYGLDCLATTYRGTHGERLRSSIDGAFPNLISELESTFNGWQESFRSDTYITSLTEQGDGEEESGRLSMWRGYPGITAVAIVVNGGPFLRPSDALGAYTTPVAYLTKAMFDDEFGAFVAGIQANMDFLKALPADVVFAHLFAAFRFAALATKHRGFIEEREWRVFYQPSFRKSDRLIKEIVALRGRPQPIYKIPLRDIPEEGLYGVEIPDLVDRIIIGPGANQRDTRDAFIDLLKDAGVFAPASKVYMSDIPLRAAI